MLALDPAHADSLAVSALASIERCGPPMWFGTAHTHIALYDGQHPYPGFSGSDRGVMMLWWKRWQVDGIFCVLYSPTMAHCETSGASAGLVAAWSGAKSPADFRARLTERGFVLARDDRGGLHAVDALDRSAKDHPITERTLPGANREGVRDELDRVDRKSLPTVERARAAIEQAHDRREGIALGDLAANALKGVGQEVERGMREIGKGAADLFLPGAGGDRPRPEREKKPEQKRDQAPEQKREQFKAPPRDQGGPKKGHGGR